MSVSYKAKALLDTLVGDLRLRLPVQAALGLTSAFDASGNPVIGWPGLKFKQATIVESQYMPGVDGINDADIGDYSSPQGTGATGETLLWLNPGGEGDDAYVRLHIAASEKFQFGFTGFKVGRDDTMVAGQVLFGGNLIIRTPRLMRLLHGITAA